MFSLDSSLVPCVNLVSLPRFPFFFVHMEEKFEAHTIVCYLENSVVILAELPTSCAHLLRKTLNIVTSFVDCPAQVQYLPFTFRPE